MAIDGRAADVVVLDGEAQPTGGIGISRQIHMEAKVIPPVVLTVRRAVDRWLATWSQGGRGAGVPARPDHVGGDGRHGAASGRRHRRWTGRAELTCRTGGPGRSLLARLLDGTDLVRRRHRLGDGPDHVRRRHGCPGRGVRDRTAGQGRDRRRGVADWSPRCSRTRSGSRSAGPRRRHRRYRRRPVEHGEHLDDVGGGDRRGRRDRWSSTATGPRPAGAVPPTCSRVSASRSRWAPTAVAATVAEVGIGFCFAPVFHPSLRHAAGPRREMGVPTVFNFLGPLTNPAQPAAGAIGCGNPRHGAGDGAGVRRPRRRGAAVPRRRRAGRTDHDDHVDGLGGPGRDGREADSRPGIGSGSRWRHRSRCAAATSAFNVAVARDLFAGAIGPVRDAVVLNAGRRTCCPRRTHR